VNDRPINQNWTRRRPRFDARFNPVKSELKLEGEAEVSFVPMDAVGELGKLRLDEQRALDEVYNGYTYFRDGDILVAKITPCFENGKGARAVGLVGGVGFGTTELHVARPGDALDGRFLFYITIAHNFRSLGKAEMLGAGGQKRVPERFLKDWQPAIPSLRTQERIADFLDKKTAQIDALIAKKRTLLERLAEKRQAIITQAVTKGLDPSVPMKDSGIEWLGQIPAHWEVKRLKFFTDGLLKYGANAPADWDNPSWPRFIRITDVGVSGKLNDETFRSLPPDIADPYLLTEGDILLARSGATVGKSFIYHPEWGTACYAGYLIRARISRLHDAQFIFLFLNSSSFWSWVAANFIQSTIQNINADKYANIWVPCPPKEEQRAIALYAAQTLSTLEKHEKTVSQSAVTLHEYRSALITAAVTGQIKGLQ